MKPPKRILLPISVTSRDAGRGLSNTNLESRHSWRMKLLKRTGKERSLIPEFWRYSGASISHHGRVRVLTTRAWHQLSVQQSRCQYGYPHEESSSDGQPAQTVLSKVARKTKACQSRESIFNFGGNHLAYLCHLQHKVYIQNHHFFDNILTLLFMEPIIEV